jgi:hypothetical protein
LGFLPSTEHRVRIGALHFPSSHVCHVVIIGCMKLTSTGFERAPLA